MSRARGFTLIEALLAGTLTLILMQLFVMVLVPMGRAALRGSDKVELRQMAAAAIDKLAGDLNRATPDGISYSRPATGNLRCLIGIHPLTDTTADGRMAWDTHLVVYSYDVSQKRLLRQTWPPGPPVLSWVPPSGSAVQASPADLMAMAQGNNGTQTTLAGWVEDFQAVPDGSLVRLSLKVERQGLGRGGKESYSLDFAQYLRNP